MEEQRLLLAFHKQSNPELKAPRKWARDLQSHEIELTGYFKHQSKKYL